MVSRASSSFLSSSSIMGDPKQQEFINMMLVADVLLPRKAFKYAERVPCTRGWGTDFYLGILFFL
jgi:hypothetical protein